MYRILKYLVKFVKTPSFIQIIVKTNIIEHCESEEPLSHYHIDAVSVNRSGECGCIKSAHICK